MEDQDVLRKLMFVRYEEQEAFEHAELQGPLHGAIGREPQSRVFGIDNVMSIYLPPLQVEWRCDDQSINSTPNWITRIWQS